RGWVAPVAATEQPSQDPPTIQIRKIFSSGPRRILEVSGSMARDRIPTGAIGSSGFCRQSRYWPPDGTTAPPVAGPPDVSGTAVVPIRPETLPRVSLGTRRVVEGLEPLPELP